MCCSPHYPPGPCSPWRAETGSGLGITGCPVTLAAEPAGRAIVARGTRPEAVRRLQARRARTYPTLGITGAAVATATGLVTLWPPHSWATLCGIRRMEGNHWGLSSSPAFPCVSLGPHTPIPSTPAPEKAAADSGELLWGPKHLCPGREAIPEVTSHSPLEQSSPLQPGAHWHWLGATQRPWTHSWAQSAEAEMRVNEKMPLPLPLPNFHL